MRQLARFGNGIWIWPGLLLGAIALVAVVYGILDAATGPQREHLLSPPNQSGVVFAIGLASITLLLIGRWRSNSNRSQAGWLAAAIVGLATFLAARFELLELEGNGAANLSTAAWIILVAAVLSSLAAGWVIRHLAKAEIKTGRLTPAPLNAGLIAALVVVWASLLIPLAAGNHDSSFVGTAGNVAWAALIWWGAVPLSLVLLGTGISRVDKTNPLKFWLKASLATYTSLVAVFFIWILSKI